MSIGSGLAMKQWVGIAVETAVPWPTTDTVVQYEGWQVTLRADTPATLPTAELEFEPPTTSTEARRVLRRFLSSLAWAEGHWIREVMNVGGGLRIRCGRSLHGRVVTDHFRADSLPAPQDPRARLALGLYREALGLNSEAYKFLGFFKIINILCAAGDAQIAWISGALPQLTDHDAVKRLHELQTCVPDVASYLYASGRCAVAHAHGTPTVDPDDTEDTARLQADLPLMQALAVRAIEQDLGIRTMRSVWREHLYELDGFRRILGQDLVSAMKAGGTPDPGGLPEMPKLCVRLRRHDPFPALEGLRPERVIPLEGGLHVISRSEKVDLGIALTLDFRAERLVFDPMSDVQLADDGTVNAVMAAIDCTRLIRGMVMNGQLEVWSLDSGELLGRCDPCVPVNIDSRRTLENLDSRLAILGLEGERRRGAAEGGERGRDAGQ